MLLAMILVIFVFDFIISQIYKSQEKRKNAIIFVSGIVLFLYAALRSPTIGTDTQGYINKYVHYAEYDFRTMWSILSKIKDPAYYMMGWIFSRIFPDPQWWLAAIAAVYIIPVMRFIQRYSRYPTISVLAFIALSYFSFSLTGLRQTIAMAIALSSIRLIEDRRPVKFVLLVLLASLFHISAIVFLIAYPITLLKIGYKHILAFIVVGVFFLGFQSYARIAIGLLFGENRLAGYADRTTSLTASGFIIQLCIFMFCSFYYIKADKNNAKLNMLMNLSFIGLCFQMYAAMIAEMFRVSMYFSVANIVLIPIAIAQENRLLTRQIELFVIFSVLVAFIFRNGIPNYAFFWSQVSW